MSNDVDFMVTLGITRDDYFKHTETREYVTVPHS